jgi:hypothetical protein
LDIYIKKKGKAPQKEVRPQKDATPDDVSKKKKHGFAEHEFIAMLHRPVN